MSTRVISEQFMVENKKLLYQKKLSSEVIHLEKIISCMFSLITGEVLVHLHP